MQSKRASQASSSNVAKSSNKDGGRNSGLTHNSMNNTRTSLRKSQLRGLKKNGKGTDDLESIKSHEFKSPAELAQD